MLKTHDLKTIIINHIAINYFYTREKNDRNGNPRYRVYIIDPEGAGLYWFALPESLEIKKLEDIIK